VALEEVECFVNVLVHRQQLAQDKQNLDFAPPGKISADAQDSRK